MREGIVTLNRFAHRELLSPENLQAAGDIEQRFIESDSGLYVIFEHRLLHWPSQPRIEPFTVARHDFDRDGVEAGTPNEVASYLQEPDWETLIWLPSGVVTGCALRFSVRYAHELQHYRQLLGCESLANARRFLAEKRRRGFSPMLVSERNPSEFDADVVALDTLEVIHGPSAIDRLIEIDSEDQVMQNFYQRILPLRAEYKEFA